jgi:hypothetical protein
MAAMIAKKVEDYLLPLLGPNTARIAVITLAESLHKKAEDLDSSDLSQLAKSMQRMLKNLLGAEVAAKAVKEIAEL